MVSSQESQSDLELVQAIAEGQRDAFAVLYDRHSSTMLALSFRILKDRREAEDLLHDVFLEVWRKAHTYDPARGKVSTWLLMRVRSRALDRLRSAHHTRTVPLEPAILADSTSSDDPSRAPDRRILHTTLQTLPPEQRRVLELGYFHGLSSSEIAKRVNIPIGTVKSRVAAGLAKLRKGMREPPTHKPS